MAVSPEIKTKRLLIAPFCPEHLTERYISWLNDPEVVKYSEQRQRKHDFESCQAYLESFNGSPHYFWAIIIVDGISRHIGNINAYVDEVNSVADVGIMIGEKSLWGRGYGGEAWQAVCNYLIRKRQLRKVTAGALSLNLGMIRVMKKLGMAPDGIRKRHHILGREEVDIVHMALFKEED